MGSTKTFGSRLRETLLFLMGMAVVLVGAALVFLIITENKQEKRESTCVSGTPSTEAFSKAYTGGQILTVEDVFVPVTGWTDTVDTIAFPDIPPANLFVSLSAGNLNLSTGVFTVGRAGVYSTTFDNYAFSNSSTVYIHIFVNGIGGGLSHGVETAVYSTLLNLQVNDTVRIGAILHGPTTIMAEETETQFTPNLFSYSLTWTMSAQ
jgi:hypothetical protein